jgi:outer membrane biosynthesis protein TonB
MSQDIKQGRKLGFAILVSIILHLAIGFSLAAFGNVFTPPTPVEEETPELTLIDLSTPAPPVEKNVPFIETEASKEAAEKPKQQTFESNANSLAASERPATGDLPLPSQDGKDKPALDLDTHDYSLSQEGSTPQPQQTPPPEKKPSEPPKPSPSPASTAEPDQLAMLKSTPPPPIKAPDETEPTPTPEVAPATTPVPRPQPQKPASNYQSQKQQTRIQGSISTHGPSSVNALGTPLGRYQKQMYDAVGARWYQYMERRRDVIGIGTARLSFSIDRSGRVTNLRVIENSANEAFAGVCLQSVQELKLPPIPEDVASTLPAEGLQAELTFISYAN